MRDAAVVVRSTLHQPSCSRYLSLAGDCHCQRAAAAGAGARGAAARRQRRHYAAAGRNAVWAASPAGAGAATQPAAQPHQSSSAGRSAQAAGGALGGRAGRSAAGAGGCVGCRGCGACAAGAAARPAATAAPAGAASRPKEPCGRPAGSQALRERARCVATWRVVCDCGAMATCCLLPSSKQLDATLQSHRQSR